MITSLSFIGVTLMVRVVSQHHHAKVCKIRTREIWPLVRSMLAFKRLARLAPEVKHMKHTIHRPMPQVQKKGNKMVYELCD